MIGPIQTGTLSTAQISARIHSGLAVQLPDGRPGMDDRMMAFICSVPSKIEPGHFFRSPRTGIGRTATAARFRRC